MKAINDRGMVVIGCGFMGKALLEGLQQLNRAVEFLYRRVALGEEGCAGGG